MISNIWLYFHEFLLSHSISGDPWDLAIESLTDLLWMGPGLKLYIWETLRWCMTEIWCIMKALWKGPKVERWFMLDMRRFTKDNCRAFTGPFPRCNPILSVGRSWIRFHGFTVNLLPSRPVLWNDFQKHLQVKKEDDRSGITEIESENDSKILYEIL